MDYWAQPFYIHVKKICLVVTEWTGAVGIMMMTFNVKKLKEDLNNIHLIL